MCPNNNIEILTPTEFKKQNGGKDDNEYQDFVDAVTHFDFKTVNDLFDLISNNIVVYGK